MKPERSAEEILNEVEKISNYYSEAGRWELTDREAMEITTRLQLEVLLDIRQRLSEIYADFPANGF